MIKHRNLLTVAVNNTLTRFTVPQGYTKWGVEAQCYPAGYSTLEYNFDFFNYAGIHRLVLKIKRLFSKIPCCIWYMLLYKLPNRPVTLYTTPKGIHIR